MNIVTLAEAKKHLNLDDYIVDDDDYITMLIDVATERVETHLDIKFDDVFNDLVDVPKSIKHGILLVVGEMYRHRELTTTESEINHTYSLDWLLANYKNYSY